jgi:hypothetical protein
MLTDPQAPCYMHINREICRPKFEVVKWNIPNSRMGHSRCEPPLTEDGAVQKAGGLEAKLEE